VSCICKDCCMDTTPRKRPGEYYMIHDALWFAAGMTHHPDGEDAQFKEYLCIGCLEKRLGRELTGVDFIVTSLASSGVGRRCRARSSICRRHRFGCGSDKEGRTRLSKSLFLFGRSGRI
jgi:hypothetical protein